MIRGKLKKLLQIAYNNVPRNRLIVCERKYAARILNFMTPNLILALSVSFPNSLRIVSSCNRACLRLTVHKAVKDKKAIQKLAIPFKLLPDFVEKT